MKRSVNLSAWKKITQLIFSLSVFTAATAYAAPGTDPISQIENYLDEIRLRIDNIQQSVNEVEQPPLVEKVVETFDFNVCASLGSFLWAGGQFDISAPVKLEGEVQPGLEVVSALAQAFAALSGAVSGNLNGAAELTANVCLDMYKLSKVLLEEIQLQAGDDPVGLLGDLSQDSRDYLIAFAQANPAGFYNALLEPTTNQAFGFNPDTVTNVAYAVDQAIQSRSFVDNPSALFTDATAQINNLIAILPFAGHIENDLNAVFNAADTLNPCNYRSQVPGVAAQSILNGSCAAVAGVESSLDTVVDTLDNLLMLADIEAAVEFAEDALTVVRNTTFVAINGLVSGVQTATSVFCNAIPVISC